MIRQRFKPADLVCRWSDSDLITITDLKLPEVAMRIADLDATLAGPYSRGSREVTLAIRSCVIERLRGEVGPQTIERIDFMLAQVVIS